MEIVTAIINKVYWRSVLQIYIHTYMFATEVDILIKFTRFVWPIGMTSNRFKLTFVEQHLLCMCAIIHLYCSFQHGVKQESSHQRNKHTVYKTIKSRLYIPFYSINHLENRYNQPTGWLHMHVHQINLYFFFFKSWQ